MTLDEILKDLQIDSYVTSRSGARNKAKQSIREAIERSLPDKKESEILGLGVGLGCVCKLACPWCTPV